MQKYSFKILELGKPAGPQTVKDINQLYVEWNRTFGKVLSDKGAKLDPDDFFRQDLAFILQHNETIMGMVLGTFFDLALNSHRDHHYLAEVPSEILQKITYEKNTKIMSIEYLTLHADCRKTASDILWSEALMALALRHADTTGVLGVIGRPRLDLKVKESLRRLGCQTLHEGISKMNYLCSVEFMPATSERRFFNAQTEATTLALWEQRVYSSYEKESSVQSDPPSKFAA